MIDGQLLDLAAADLVDAAVAHAGDVQDRAALAPQASATIVVPMFFSSRSSAAMAMISSLAWTMERRMIVLGLVVAHGAG